MLVDARSKSRRSDAVESAEKAIDPLQMRSVTKTYTRGSDSILALSEFSLTVKDREFITIVGPSGCGKSSLLRMILGTLKPTSGDILVRGAAVEGPHAGVGMVFQSPVLMQWRSVLQNVLLPIEIAGRVGAADVERARGLIKLVGLAGFEDRHPRQLSGGMQQRVSICRALVTDPSLLLMDEPFGALDALTREQMCFELLQLWSDRPKTVLFVTHDIDEAVFLADRVVAMTPRPGKLASIETIDLPRPRSDRIKASPEFAAHVLNIRSALGVLKG
jgi:NitT/TauT family transport system ATP-binding protein